MSYNYTREFNKWKKWKTEEEALLMKLNVSEQVILQLREYDWKMFKQDRHIRSRQYPTKDAFFLNIPYYDKKEISDLSDLLNEIENEALFQYLSQYDQITMTIVYLKILGYSTKEISIIMQISCAAIYSRIKRLKKNIKNIMQDD